MKLARAITATTLLLCLLRAVPFVGAAATTATLTGCDLPDHCKTKTCERGSRKGQQWESCIDCTENEEKGCEWTLEFPSGTSFTCRTKPEPKGSYSSDDDDPCLNSVVRLETAYCDGGDV